MKQLELGTILNIAKELKSTGMTQEKINKMPIYIGNDDELNGIHTAWFLNIVDPTSEDDESIVEMINEDHHNIKLTGMSILIS